ncbi:MAG: GDSL-type esterase/lipase family protein [Microcoleaceae cyanobacterium]
MVLTPNSELGLLIGDDSAELISLTPGQLTGFPLGVLTLGGNDTIFGSIDSEQINGNQDEDQISGSGGNDTLFGGKNNDVLDGQAGDDLLFGNLSADLMRGGQGNDNLFGGADNDVLFGDFGNDLLSGDLGIDVVTGGEGADIFALPSRGIDTDFISDFEDGIDLMLLPPAIAFSQLSITPRGSDQTVIALGTEELAVLDDILPDAITTVDFVGNNNNGGGDNGGGDNGGGNNGGEIPRDNGIIIRLDRGFLYDVDLETPLRIMPLGDSITEGQIDRNIPDALQEGYRIGLWNRLIEFGIPFDFVGSNSSGTDNLPDKDHEGNSGFNTNQIRTGVSSEPDSGVNNWIPAANPNMILLMVGTNNSADSPDGMLTELDRLIDQILDRNSYTGELIVSTIPPINPAGRFEERIPNVEGYNAGIPTLIDSYIQQGINNISFVDMVNVANGLTAADITPPPDDSGIHPTAAGYEKIADFWFDAILDQAGTTEGLSDPNNGTGTDFNDVIVGNDQGNSIEGGLGIDRLSGGEGADAFIYTASNQGLDTITDFSADEGDVIAISANEFGGGLLPQTPLSTVASASGTFVSATNPTPVGNSANILYNSNSGIVSFDVDGVGAEASVELALLVGAPEISVNQFLIF